VAEYRLNDLAVLSGVSARNIRAYRERGLLDAPQRRGRAAYYGDQHLAQLRAIAGLLQRGFSTAHIAEFITGMREGHDLADVLGMHDAIFGSPATVEPAAVDIDPDGDEATRLRDLGLAEVASGRVVLANPALARIVRRSPEPVEYVRTLLRLADATAEPVERLATAVVDELTAAAIDRFGEPVVPDHESMAEMRRVIADHRELAEQVVTDRLGASMRRHSSAAVEWYTTDVLLGGNWGPGGGGRVSSDAGARGVSAEALRQPHRDDREDGQRRGDDVDDGGLVGTEQVAEDPDRQGLN
jgi:DNA-binding transcriptional MerR regulator